MNNKNLLSAISYLREVICLRMEHYLDPSQREESLKLPPFRFKESKDLFTHFVLQAQLTIEEFIVLLLALVPHVQSHFFEDIVAQFLPEGGEFPPIGGIRGKDYRYMLPTVETALFVLAGGDLGRRLELMAIMESEHFLVQNKVVYPDTVHMGEPFSSSRLLIDSEYIELFIKGKVSIPTLSTAFPAQMLHTEQEWEDLVLPHDTLEQLKEVEIWVKHSETMRSEWGLAKKVKPGYKALFYGPPGTGKTLAASLIGKYTGKRVFRVDLSKIISKYIGETEKNLANFFDKAQNKDWCIFFDEADACFGKRTQTKDAKDRYANQEISYLLQRIEEYPGLVILASNLKSNIDKAFLRRFNSIIYFPVPKAVEREQIWSRAFPQEVSLDTAIDWSNLSKKYELTGANIMNVVQYACLQALHNESEVIEQDYILKGIRKEYVKEGK